MSMPLAGVVTSGGAERVAELQGRLAGEQAKRAKARGDAAAENRRDCANPACPRQAKQRIDLLACARLQRGVPEGTLEGAQTCLQEPVGC